ncbi:hypothetical protein SMACR_05697 [Sordaria macrospora]|uniref:WGS project CABT00000000 data, contig 2.30 n=2 Tax=Sordaria macrospora TaxID=5147 RepID=F7W5F0_SORMK|nr:uncharacterized protein SMAC_05697 [Sordaria macrospora k-hell]KAA8632515.1 hypothetical protein SMACR_05697 [Sordaria macrospora]WPJ65497.1 hypothetical protein SMAC4_05697 [Sordaria macrospora]CCC12738.1 unnamed protein product [Sordaria macrospora k-hell]
MPPTFSFRDSLDEPPQITLGRKAWQWYTLWAKTSKNKATEQDLWKWVINEIGPGRGHKSVSREQREQASWKCPISYPPGSKGYEFLQQHIALQFEKWFITKERWKVPVLSSSQAEPLSIQIRCSISNILNGGSWIMDHNNGGSVHSTASQEITPEPCTDSEHFIRTSLYPAWKAVCDFHKWAPANIFCFDLPYNYSHLAFEIVDAMASCQCPHTTFRLVLDSSKYTEQQAVELLTTERPLAADKELVVEVTDGSVEARTTLIQQVGDSTLIIDGTNNSCILQAIRDPVIHFFLTGKKGDAPKPWGIFKFIVNWDDRGFYERAAEATKAIPKVPSLPVKSDQSDTSVGDLFDDDRFKFMLALWRERKRPIDDIVRDHFPDFEMEPGFRLPEEARLDLLEALLDEDLSDVFVILDDFYSGMQFIYSEFDVDARWKEVLERMKGLEESIFGSGLKGGMRGSDSATFTPQHSSNTQVSLKWDDPELIRSEDLVDPLEQGGIVLENHFDRRFPDLFIDLVYDVRYRWMDPGFGQIFNPTLYFCKHRPTGSKDNMASSMPRFKHPSFDVERRHLHDLKRLATTKPDSTIDDGGRTVSPPSKFEPDCSSRVHTPSKASSLESQPLSPGWVPFGHKRAWKASILDQN